MPSNLPADCASHDHGGGVGLGNAFVVYTTNPYHAHLQAIASQLLDTLASLASTVSRHIKILYTLPPGTILHSLPHPPPTQPSQLTVAFLKGRDRPQTPSFFVNACSSREICVAGIQDAVTTLLSVLRRPWCVLELCGAGTEAVEALLAFAEAAKGFNEKEYIGAVALLRHQRSCQFIEEQRRAALGGSGVPERLRGTRGREREIELVDICAALFNSSLESFNGFYMRAIVVCAVIMGVEWGAMRISLIGNAANPWAQMLGRDLVRLPSKTEVGIRKQMWSSKTLDALLDLQQDEQLRNSFVYHKDLTTQASLTDSAPLSGHNVEGPFLDLYSAVLEHLAFNIA